MSALTLTIPADYESEREVQFRLAGVSFYFQRGYGGEGLWYTAERIGNTRANTSVPMMMQSDLTAMAKERGLSERYNFSRNPPKPVKVKTPRGPRKSKAPASPLMGSFNPFAAS